MPPDFVRGTHISWSIPCHRLEIVMFCVVAPPTQPGRQSENLYRPLWASHAVICRTFRHPLVPSNAGCLRLYHTVHSGVHSRGALAICRAYSGKRGESLNALLAILLNSPMWPLALRRAGKTMVNPQVLYVGASGNGGHTLITGTYYFSPNQPITQQPHHDSLGGQCGQPKAWRA